MSNNTNSCVSESTSVSKDDGGKLVPRDDGEILTCAVCHESCRAMCVFQCGHFTCYACGLRIHVINKKGCPVCRVGDKEPIVTRMISANVDFYSADEIESMLVRATRDGQLNCLIDGVYLAELMSRLYTFLCPMRKCWFHGQQDAFDEMSFLRDHLLIDHGRRYCEICLQKRAAFLCEQTLYSKSSLDQHMDGRCPFDTTSFTGHPRCRFCTTNNRFYDGEELLSHMQLHHYTCDICNRGQFIFTFYKNHDTLIQHYVQNHKLCPHPDCAGLDPMLRVFADDVELAMHRQTKHGMKHKSIITAGVAGTGQGGSSAFMPAVASLGSGSGSASALGHRNPATASNTNVEHIIFDHVTSGTDMEEIMPAHARHGRGNRSHGHRATGGGEAESRITGLPPHYYRSGTFVVLRRVCDAKHTSDTTCVVHEEGKTVKEGGQASRAQEAMALRVGGTSSQADAVTELDSPSRCRVRLAASASSSSPAATAVSSSSSHPSPARGASHGITDAAEEKPSGGRVGGGESGAPPDSHALSVARGPTGSPLSTEAARARLRETLSRVLTSPLDLTEFSELTHLYQNGVIKTGEFCEALHRLLPSQPAVLKEVVSLLLATLSSENQRFAMQSMWKMRMAPEMLQMKRAQEEQKVADAARQAAAAAAASSPSKRSGSVALSGLSSPPITLHRNSGKAGAAKSKNAWLREPKKLLEGVTTGSGGGALSSSGSGGPSDIQASVNSPSPTNTRLSSSGAGRTTTTWSVVTPAGVSSSELPEWRRAAAGTATSQPLQSLYGGGSDRVQSRDVTDGADFSAELYPALPRQSKPRRSNAPKSATRSNAWVTK